MPPDIRRVDPAAEAEIAAQLHLIGFAGRERPWSAAEFAALGGGGSFLLLAAPAPGAAAVGLLLGRAAGGEAELLTLAAAPPARRMGIGRALLEAFHAEAAAAGAEDAFLEVAVDNAPALALYRGAGWQEVGRRRAYLAMADGRKVDALVMRRALGG